ncbi:hypothetical protein QTP88_003656 [Uroleucon formosanum]
MVLCADSVGATSVFCWCCKLLRVTSVQDLSENILSKDYIFSMHSSCGFVIFYKPVHANTFPLQYIFLFFCVNYSVVCLILNDSFHVSGPSAWSVPTTTRPHWATGIAGD